MGFQLDLTQRTTNVSWGGSVFIYAEQSGNKLYYVQPSGNSNPTIRTITLPESETLFQITGSSYAVVGKTDDSPGIPTFLVCGLRSVLHDIDDGLGNSVTVIDTHAIIYLSNNGIKWRIARDQTETISDLGYQTTVGPVALVWNPTDKAFYYDQYLFSIKPSTSVTTSKDQIFKSPNGTAWTQRSSADTDSADFKSEFPSLCVSNDCKDSLGQNVPDGVMATDSEGKNTAKPTSPPTIYYPGRIDYSSGENTVRVKRTTKDESGNDVVEQYTTSIPAIGGITCVAGRGSILMAGGAVDKDDIGSAGVVVLSTDAGKTWRKIGTTGSGVVTMISAPPPKSAGG